MAGVLRGSHVRTLQIPTMPACGVQQGTEGQIHFGEEYIKDNGVKKSKIKSQCDERKLLLNISSPHYLTKKNNARSRGDWRSVW